MDGYTANVCSGSRSAVNDKRIKPVVSGHLHSCRSQCALEKRGPHCDRKVTDADGGRLKTILNMRLKTNEPARRFKPCLKLTADADMNRRVLSDSGFRVLDCC